MDEDLDRWTVTVDADTVPLQRALVRVASFGEQFGRTLTQAFEGLILRGRDFGDVLRSLAQRLSQLAFRAAFKPLEQAFGRIFNGGFAAGAIGPGVGSNRRALPVPFAGGGIVSSPTYFPLAGGRTGVMGERGTEAILPLRRGADGRLGVAAAGASALNITFNVSTPDAESFARSEAQIAALLSRAVGRGQRIL